jgi:hypothetical protein
MLTDVFYIQLSALIKSEPLGGGSLYLAIGTGEAAWDSTPPLLRRDRTALTAEVARKIVSPEDILYISGTGEVSAQPTSRLRVQATFLAGEGRGTLRECGLLMGEESNAVLLAYFIHPRVEKLVDGTLLRSIQLDLTPGRPTVQEMPTRYLGNSKTEELHDLENETAACQLNEIRIDRRHFFNSIDEAVGLGYDYCAFCFGRDLSQR